MLLIIGTENSHINNLLSKFEYKENKLLDNTVVYECDYKDHKFLLATTSYGKVNIACALTSICNNYNISVIVQTGTCGSVVRNNSIYDVVIFNKSLQYDIDFSSLGNSPCFLPDSKVGMYETNSDLRKCAMYVCDENNINYHEGIIASGDMYINNSALSNSIRKLFNACTVDNESGCTGQFAYQNNIPYVGIKVISNYAFNNGINQYNLYNEEALRICQDITYDFIKKYYD